MPAGLLPQAGVFNAVAMWFELHLDEETQLSTSPYLDKGPTWQQVRSSAMLHAALQLPGAPAPSAALLSPAGPGPKCADE